MTPDGNFVQHPAQGNLPAWASWTTAGKKLAYVALSAMKVGQTSSNGPGQGSGIQTVPAQPGEVNMNQTLQAFLQANPGVSVWADPNIQQIVFTPKGTIVGFPYALLTVDAWPSADMT